MAKFISSHWWATFFILFFPLVVMYGYAEFVRESELNARLGWLYAVTFGGVFTSASLQVLAYTGFNESVEFAFAYW